MSCIAYLVSDYHAPSHTFIRREIAGLRALGETILPFSIRGSTAEGEAAVPDLLAQPIWRHFCAVAKHLIRRPARLLKAWRRSLSHRSPGLRGLVWSQFHFVEAANLADLLLTSHACHLHSHFANSGATVGLLAAQIADIPWSVTLHGISETDYPAGYLLADKLYSARFVAIASLFMRAQAMRVTDPSVWSRFHIVRCGIDLSRMPRRTADPSAPSRPARIICIGRLSPEKGYFTLVEALAQIAEGGREFLVEIVGDGAARGAIAAALESAGLRQHVNLLGALPEDATLDRIAAADMLVLPSLMEGLPVVLMEAMAIGVPVVASRVAGIPELVEDGVSGLTFAPSDVDGMARTISRLLDEPQLGYRLAEVGMRRVAEEFTIGEAARRMQALFAQEGAS